MRIPDTKIEEIRNASDIVDLVSAYVQLKKRGKNFFGVCPFHQEKTPSFAVNDEKQIYHCFGCGNGGDVFKFLMEYKSISFVEAVQEMADHLGIKIEYDQNISAEAQSEQEAYYEINLKAAKYFSENLLKNLAGEYARDYLKGRKLSEKTMRVFGVGFALPGWDNFLKFARESEIDLKQAASLGLIDTKDNGDYYDKYRNRIMFPIFSTNGRIIAFGGRVLDDSEKAAKYLNSPESLVYHKKRSLYGLYHAKEEIRKLDKVILVEGYMDVIALFQGGVKNVVASSGTSLTEEQVQLISRFTKNIVLLFDADAAGMKASLRSIELLLKQNFEVKIATLPKGEDPDSFINNSGKETFDEQISKAQNFLEYQTTQFKEAGMFDDPAKHTEAIREMVKSASLVIDELKRNLLIKSIAKKFGLREKLIESEFLRYKIENQKPDERPRSRFNKTYQIEKLKHEQTEISTKEIEIIEFCFQNDEQILFYLFENIAADDIVNERMRKIFEQVHELLNDGVVLPQEIIENLKSEEDKQFIRNMLLNKHEISRRQWGETYEAMNDRNLNRKYVFDIVQKFILSKLKDRDKEISILIETTIDENESKELLKYQSEINLERVIERKKKFEDSPLFIN